MSLIEEDINNLMYGLIAVKAKQEKIIKQLADTDAVLEIECINCNNTGIIKRKQMYGWDLDD